jgi:hypothetical protein
MSRLCFVLISLSFFGSVTDRMPCAQPTWVTDIAKSYQFPDFGTTKHENSWVLPPNQQGIEFISPEVLAVYQVSEVDEPQVLSQKDPSGGSGRYLLHVSILDVTRKTELKSFQFVTSGWLPSQVFPTHDGRFVIRTGQLIRSFSPSFAQVAIAHLPNSQNATQEWYQISVSASRRFLYVRHTKSDSLTSESGTAVLDADSLRPANGEPENHAASGEDSHGFTFVAEDRSCPHGITKITPKIFVGYGCKELRFFSQDGEVLWDIPVEEQVVSVRATGAVLAAFIKRHYVNLLHPDAGPEPLRIDLFDIDAKLEKCSISVKTELVSGHWPPISYTVSSSGGVAIRQGAVLSVYGPSQVAQSQSAIQKR